MALTLSNFLVRKPTLDSDPVPPIDCELAPGEINICLVKGGDWSTQGSTMGRLSDRFTSGHGKK
jgi:hypothetical protein